MEIILLYYILIFSSNPLIKGGGVIVLEIIKKIKLIYRIIYFKIIRKFNITNEENIFYIGGSEALPPPLSPEEELFLVDRLRQDDGGIRTVLIERNLRLVVYIARKFENTGIGVEDLISIGTIGLIKAVNTFDPEKKIKLATYASRCIENEILMYLRRNSKAKAEISFDEPLNIDWDGNELLLSDILGTDNDLIYKFLEEEVDRELLEIALKKLSSREKKIMELRFGLNNGEEKTQKEVADMLGISQSYISRLEKRIISRLRKEIKRLT
ncbi:RNA polymerase sporulation sigma factor SigE [Crassaminicella thermophila]|uniref:RNA polymerase sigma factor n=1 Tax=Crassaminicella thermophila TaxID=2599308 RepID=A0A5C0SCX1_CRATE|nr:RNA polymerase sporulation sigma factor SigE [Crassaminicella thermophila]